MIINQIGVSIYLGENPNIWLDTAQVELFLSEPDTVDFTQLLDRGKWATFEKGGPAWYFHYTMVINGLDKGTVYSIAPFLQLTVKGKEGYLLNRNRFTDPIYSDWTDDYATYQTKYRCPC